MSKKVLIASILILYFQGAIAQNLLHSKPLDYNPGFAGSKTYDRISFHVNEVGNYSRNLYFSYDKLSKGLNGGIGFYGNSKRLIDEYDDKRYQITEGRYLSKIGAVYSTKLLLSEKVLLSPSLMMDYNHYSYQMKQSVEESDLFLSRERRFALIGTNAGLLLNTKNGYIGYQLRHQYAQTDGNYIKHSFQTGYVFSLAKDINVIVDARYNHGEQIDDFCRHYDEQLNLAYQYKALFVGAGINDFKHFSGLMGVKLINLKINMAYHMLDPSNSTNLEIGVQYTFNKNNDQTLKLPFERWLLKLKM